MNFDEDELWKVTQAAYDLEPVKRNGRTLSWDEAVDTKVDLSVYHRRAEAILSSSYDILKAKMLSDVIFKEAKGALDIHWAGFYNSWQDRSDGTMLSCVYMSALLDLAARIGAHLEISPTKFKLIVDESMERASASLPRFG